MIENDNIRWHRRRHSHCLALALDWTNITLLDVCELLNRLDALWSEKIRGLKIDLFHGLICVCVVVCVYFLLFFFCWKNRQLTNQCRANDISLTKMNRGDNVFMFRISSSIFHFFSVESISKSLHFAQNECARNGFIGTDKPSDSIDKILW